MLLFDQLARRLRFRRLLSTIFAVDFRLLVSRFFRNCHRLFFFVDFDSFVMRDIV